jgi:hypothetical protein
LLKRISRSGSRLTLMCRGCFAQSSPPGHFEVASVKHSAQKEWGRFRGGPGSKDPERVTYESTPLENLIRDAYHLLPYQTSGPQWLNTEFSRRRPCSLGFRRRSTPRGIGSWRRRVNSGNFVGSRRGVKNEEPAFRVAIEADNFRVADPGSNRTRGRYRYVSRNPPGNGLPAGSDGTSTAPALMRPGFRAV